MEPDIVHDVRMPMIPSPAELHELVSGRKKGVRAAFFRAILTALEPFYFAATAFRNWRYDSTSSLSTRVSVPVISVGNLTVGGTGKTPLVLWLSQRLREEGLRVAIISRGYGAESSRNDEAMELEQRLPDVPHIQHADRVAGAKIATDELESQIIVLDDAFQHRKIARDLDIVLIDALCPFGYGHLLPRGLLRESLRGVRRAQAIILSRSDLVAASERSSIRSIVSGYNPSLVWAEASHSPSRLVNASGQATDLATIQNARVAVFCGIGNPAGFLRTVEDRGAEICAFRAFPDHHAYSAADVADLRAWAKRSGATFVICTQKDLVKLQIDVLGEAPLWAIQVDMLISTGRAELELAIKLAAARAKTT